MRIGAESSLNLSLPLGLPPSTRKLGNDDVFNVRSESSKAMFIVNSEAGHLRFPLGLERSARSDGFSQDTSSSPRRG